MAFPGSTVEPGATLVPFDEKVPFPTAGTEQFLCSEPSCDEFVDEMLRMSRETTCRIH